MKTLNAWMIRMLSDGDRAAHTQEDTFWADMRAKAIILNNEIQLAVEAADELILDQTRALMGLSK